MERILDGTTGTFEVGEPLGEGGFGVTYIAKRQHDGLACVVKTLRLEKLTDWKAVELFEREANVLQNLRHPNIPRYVDSFPLGGREAPRGLVLVQELVRGRSLASIMRGDTRLPPGEMRAWLAQILDVLVYLHALAPPVIHRDISPKNVLLREDGRAFLIDFGTVQAAVRAGSVASTSAGTFGYAPMEQFMGRAFPASDLYGLAMTYIAVMTGLEPEELPLDGVRLDVRRAIRDDARLILLLDAMTEPDPRRRLGDAGEALARLSPLLPHVEHRPPAAPPAARATGVEAPEGHLRSMAKPSPAPLPPVTTSPKRPHRPSSDAVTRDDLVRAARYIASVSVDAIWKENPLPKLGPMEACGVTVDGERAVVWPSSDRVVILHLETLAATDGRELPPEQFHLWKKAQRRAVSPDGKLVAIAKGGDVRVGEDEARARAASPLKADTSGGLFFTPDGGALVCVGGGQACVFAESGAEGRFGATKMDIRVDGRVVALAQGAQLSVGVASALVPALQWAPWTTTLASEVTGLRFAPDGSWLATSHHKTLALWRVGQDGAVDPSPFLFESDGELTVLGFGREGRVLFVVREENEPGHQWPRRALLLLTPELETIGEIECGDYGQPLVVSGASGLWTRFGNVKRDPRQEIVARALREARCDLELLSSDERAHADDLALRRRFAVNATGVRPTKAARAVDALRGLSHVLPTVLARATTASVPMFGSRERRKAVPVDAIVGAAKELLEKPHELDVHYEESLRVAAS